VHLLQIWILPNQRDLTPGYEQKAFSQSERTGQLRLIASVDGHDGSVKINQDANVFASILKTDLKLEHELSNQRHAWIQVARGSISVTGQDLESGDGAAISDETSLKIVGRAPAEFLLFDLA
jgi:redox-sensitive bicupin YhaK (pirin superfamily)